MYVVRVKEPGESRNEYDIFDVVQPVPAEGEPLEKIQPTKEENACSMKEA